MTGGLNVAAPRFRAPLLAADACQLPFRDAAFDVTIAVTVCEFAASPAAVMAELARVTRPGGRVVIGALNRRSAWGLARRRELRRPPWQAARFLTRRQLRAFGACHGRVRLHSGLIIPGAVPGSRHAGPFLEALGRRACPAAGAFQVLAIDKGSVMTAAGRAGPAGPRSGNENCRNAAGMNGGMA
jgi:SAM-dependent methyltransferase